MKKLPKIFEYNRKWASQVIETDPSFFQRLSGQQSPRYLWIGCSDSRVPANQICGLEPGEMFVHRNVANQVIHTDFNCLTVIQYAVEVLQVSDIIVCGHYGCGGVNGAMSDNSLGLIDNWLRHIKDIYLRKFDELNAITDIKERSDRLTELNIHQQVANLAGTTVVQDAWKKGKELNLHGWVYRLDDGILRNLNICVSDPQEAREVFI